MPFVAGKPADPTLPSGRTADEIRENCALGAECQCVLERRPWACSNWGRSTLAAPNVVSAYTQTIASPAKSYRGAMREAGEKSILNNRAFSTKTEPGDMSVPAARRAGRDRARARKR